MLFYPFNIREYRKDTMHLTALEHGIYRLLLDTYYLQDGPLPADKELLMRKHCVRTKDEKQAFESVISEFFKIDQNVYRHYKCDEVIDEVMGKSEKARLSAKARWDKYYANAERTQSECNADGLLEKEKEKEKEKDLNLLSKPKVPPCPVEQIIKLYADTARKLPSIRIVPDSTKAQISARWRQDVKFQSLDFWQQFFDYCENNKFLSGQTETRPGKKPWRATLTWMVNATNFAKIINEDYS